jgi:hypothetical protein
MAVVQLDEAVVVALRHARKRSLVRAPGFSARRRVPENVDAAVAQNAGIQPSGDNFPTESDLTGQGNDDNSAA